MKKRLISFLTVLVLLVTVAGGAMACKKNSPTKAEMTKLYAMVAAANSTVKVLVRTAQATKRDDVSELLRSVDAVNAPVLRYADKIGATVVCKVVYYQIDGRRVAVDPLKVINREGGD